MTVLQLKKFCLIFLLFCVLILRLNAQDWEMGLSGGASGYMGDLNTSNFLQFNDWSAGILIKKNLSRTWAVRMNFLRANIWGNGVKNSNEVIKQQRLFFQSPIYELSLVGEFNFFKFEPSFTQVSYSPYLFAGIAGFHFQPKSYNFDGDLVNLRNYQTEGVAYNSLSLGIPFGAGFKYNLRGPFTLGVEIGYRIAFTDYLDDISGWYIDPADYPLNGDNAFQNQRNYFIDPSVSKIGDRYPKVQRGDGRKRDAYMIANFTLTYALFRAGCPVYIKGN